MKRTTSARAPWDVAPVADHGENKKQDRHEEQSSGFGGIGRMVIVMIVVRGILSVEGLCRNGGVHGAIVASPV